MIGSVGKKTQHAAVAIDLKLVNVNTATVVASKNANAQGVTFRGDVACANQARTAAIFALAPTHAQVESP